MKVSSICITNFKGKIIDAHVHSGEWKDKLKGENALRDYTPDIAIFTTKPLKNGDTVEKIIVSNLECLEHFEKDKKRTFLKDEIAGNKTLLEYAKTNSKVAPLAVCQPGYGSVENIRTLLIESPNTFVGFKFHPHDLNIPANDAVYEPYMQLAREYKMPCLFHSENTVNVMKNATEVASKASEVARPDQILKLAEKFPDVPVIMAHWGGPGSENYKYVTDIIVDSKKNNKAKIYADISWIDCNESAKSNLKNIIKKLKEEKCLDRMLFGTDAPIGRFGGQGENGVSAYDAYSNLVDDIKNMIKKEFPEEAEQIIDDIFYNNAKKLFFERPEAPPVNPGNSFSKLKVGAIAFGAIALTAGVIGLVNQSKKMKEVSLQEQGLNALA